MRWRGVSVLLVWAAVQTDVGNLSVLGKRYSCPSCLCCLRSVRLWVTNILATVSSF